MTRPAKARRKFPSIPIPFSKDPAVMKMREILNIGLGDVGNELDQFVTRRDIQEGYRVQGARIIRSNSGGGQVPTTVGILSDLVAMGAFRFINLAWSGINQEHYSYTEIWRSADDNLGNAVLVGTTRASVYPDPVGSGETWYYWIRAVSTSGDPGPYNDTNGTVATSALDPDYIVEQLEGQIGESELANELLTPIQAIPGMQTTINDHGISITTLEQDVDENYAAIQLKAETSVVNDIANDVTDIQAQFTLKLDVNGYVSGIGLMNDGATSQFIVASDAVYFVDPAQSITEFDPETNYASMDALRDTQFVFGYAEVEGQKRFAINIPAYIPEAYITDLMVQDLSADKLFAASGTLAEAIIGDGEITNAMITNVIQSNNYTADVAGWLINKSGNAEFNNVRIRGHVEAETGYIASSVQVGGTSYDLAEVVAMAEQAQDTGLIEEWKRPGTTLINGNKIYTGDAYVDTLQIKGQAVTVPDHRVLSKGIGLLNTGTWHNVGSFYFSHSEPFTIPTAMFLYYGHTAWKTTPGGGTVGVTARFRFRVGGATVYTSPYIGSSYDGSGGPVWPSTFLSNLELYNFPANGASVYVDIMVSEQANDFIAQSPVMLIGCKR